MNKKPSVLAMLSIFSLLLILYNFFGSTHIDTAGSLHKLNSNNDLPAQDAKTSDSFADNLTDNGQSDIKSLDYEVIAGDTIWGIAQKYGIKAETVLKANDLTAKSVIKPGQRLILPPDDKILANPISSKINFQIQTSLADDGDLAKSQVNNLEDDNPSERKPFDYIVENGDTISNIAERYNLKINTILWANDLTAKSVIKPGQKLVLLPVDGVLHEVKKGDIIGKIALMHRADAQKTMDYNEITDPTKIYSGDMIIIPDGQPLPPAPPKPKVSVIPKSPADAADNTVATENPASDSKEKLLWPTSAKRITQRYWAKHRGIDIANGATPPIIASHDGTVEFAGKSGNWGNTVLLRRSDGMVTRYSHASEIYVVIGQDVKAGDTIAKIGTTGRSTGNHLDFRVYKNGVAVNPMNLF